ncbi:MAG: MATE family efflux transporter [Oscillospiraceae bacterium]|nr:MATE family efflux transporter [Oscillospiraceae bacterium]
MTGNILRLAGPLTLALLVNTLYSIVDRIYIGHMAEGGKLALTGIGIAAPILMVISAFQSLCSTGGAPFFSISRGEGNEEKAGQILGNAYCLLLIFGLGLTLLGYLFKAPILWLTGASADTFHYANDYLSVYLAGTVFVLTGVGMNSFINAQGFARTGMLTVLIGALMNIALDPLFIFGFHWGVRGAAAATVISQACSSLWVFRFLTGKKAVIPLKAANLRLRKEIVLRMLGLGVAGFVMSFTNSAVSFFYNNGLSRLGGDTYVAVMTVINSLRELSFMPASGVTEGGKPVLGFNYGARAYDRCKACIRVMTLLVGAYCLCMWLAFMLAPGFLVRLFNADPELLKVGVYGVRHYYAFFFFMTFQMVGQNVFTGLGLTRRAVFFSLLRKFIILLPLILLMPGITGLGADGIFWAEPVSQLLGGTACYTTMFFTVYRQLGKKERL